MKNLMKKFTLLLVALFTMQFAIADKTSDISEIQKEVTTVTGTDTEKLVDKYVGEIGVWIESVAKSLKKPAEAVWDIYIAKYSIIGIAYVIEGIFAFLLAILGVILVLRVSNWDVGSFNAVGGVILCIIGGIGTIIFIANAPIILQHLYVPEALAIEEIMEFIKEI